jgi:pimeloyl-ACP methyl ester carboxylesterase
MPTMATVVHRGAAIHYDDLDRRVPWAPPADPVVFHHGVGACAAVWSGWDAALADRYRLVRHDLRGHGRSVVPDGYPWTLETLVDDLAAVVDHAGIERFHLVGESVGGTIALAFAARHPDRVSTLTVSNGAHRGAPIRNLAGWGGLIETGGTAAWSAYMMPLRFHDDGLDPALRDWFRTQQDGADAAAVLALGAVLAATDLTEALGDVRMPVLLVHPDGSPFIPVALMAELLDLLADARLEVVAGARHGLPFSHAGRVSTLVRSFLDGTGPASR